MHQLHFLFVSLNYLEHQHHLSKLQTFILLPYFHHQSNFQVEDGLDHNFKQISIYHSSTNQAIRLSKHIIHPHHHHHFQIRFHLRFQKMILHHFQSTLCLVLLAQQRCLQVVLQHLIIKQKNLTHCLRKIMSQSTLITTN